MSGPVFITAGGTGGHMFPAMALAQELQARGQKVRLLTDGRGARYLSDDLARHVIRAGSPSGTVWKKLTGLVQLAIGTVQSLLLIGRFRPIATTCFGGYASIPGAIASALRRVPILVHEQNAVFGRANRLIAGKARKIALSFESTSGVPEHSVSKAFFSGNPVRPGFAVDVRPGKPDGKVNLLVMGGSQGARILSDVVPHAIVGLPRSLRERLRVEQQCRAEDLARVEDAYAGSGVEVELLSFFNDVPRRMAKADLLITRSGASTIAELLIAGKPSILVPFALAADDHQRANAEQMSESGAAEVIVERDLTAERLGDALQRLLSNRDQLASMAAAACSLARPDAASSLADAVIALGGKGVPR